MTTFDVGASAQGSTSATPARETVGEPFPAHPWLSHLVVTALWAASIAASTAVQAPAPLVRVAIAAHIVGVVVALGPIILMDWYSLVWLSGLRRFNEVMRLTQAAHPLIWLGSTLLLVSGALLAPDLGSPLTWLKLAFVLILLHNGITVRTLGRRLTRLGNPRRPRDIPARLRTPMFGLFVVSQLSWWVAIVVGLLTSFSRHGL